MSFAEIRYQPMVHHPGTAVVPAIPAGRILPLPALRSMPGMTMVDVDDPHQTITEREAVRRAELAIAERGGQVPAACQRYLALRARHIGARCWQQSGRIVRVHLNPLRAWCRPAATGRGPSASRVPAAAVLLFRVDDGYVTRSFDLESQALLNELADYQPCTLDQWANHSALASPDELVAFCDELARAGLVCFA